MPSSVVELPNGEELEFPEGVDESTQLAETQKYWMRHQQTEATAAGDRAEAVAGALDTVSQAIDPRPAVRAVGQGMSQAGRGWTATIEDAANAIANLPGNLLAGRGPFENGSGRPEFGSEFAAAAEGRPGPDELDEEARARAGDRTASVKLGLRDAARNLPTVAAGTALTAAGVPAPVAFGSVMGTQAYGETGDAATAAKSATLGVVMPAAGALAKAGAAQGLKSLVARGWLGADNVLAQKSVEILASQAGMQAVAEASKAPEYLAATPEQRRQMLVRSVAGNLAFALADAPALAKGAPSATAEALSNDAMALVNAALRRAPIDRMSPDQLAIEAQNPAHGYAWADAAREISSPKSNIQSEALPGAETVAFDSKSDKSPVNPEALSGAENVNSGAEVFAEKKVRGVGSYERPPDLADEIADGGHGKIRKLKPGETADNEEAWRKAQRDFPDLFSESGSGPDEVAAGVGKDPAALIDELATLKETRANDREAFKQYTTDQKQNILFQEQAIEGKDRGAMATREVLPDEFGVGDRIKVRGEEGMITKVKTRPDDETMVESVTVRFGDRYGTQEVPAGRAIKVDEGTWRRSSGASEKLEDAFTGAARLTEATNVPTSGEPAPAGTLATVEAKLLPRTVESNTPAIGSDPVSLAEIRQYLSQALDIPVRSRRYGQQALGIFKVKPETIRLRAINDIPTLAHEVGHYLHKITLGNFANFNQAFDGELLPLGKVTSRKNYTVDDVRQEGVAEFFREWMTDRSKALAKAPTFTQHFEQTLQAQYPEVWKIVTQARTDLGRYIRHPALMKLESRIDRTSGKIQVTAGQRVREFVDQTITGWVNQLHPLERAMQTARAFGLPDQEAKLVTDRAVNFIGGWRGKVEYSLEQRQIDLAGNDVGPSLHEILGEVGDLREFGTYLVGRRELELLGRGIKTGLDPRDAAGLRRELAAIDARYQKPAERLYQFQGNNLKLLKEAGLLSAEQFLKIRQVNQAYVPFFRVMEFLGGERSGGGGQGFVNLGQGIFKLKGSDRRYVDPLESVVKNAYALRELAERNAIGREFVQAIEKVEGGGRIAEKIAKRMTPTDVGGEEVAAALQAAGIDVAAMGIDAKDLAFKIWKAAQQKDPKRGILTVWREGKEEVWQLGDPDLYRALAMGDTASAKFLQNAFVKGLVIMPTRMLRAGATLTLEFVGRNPFRDQITAGVNSRYGFIPFWDGFRGMLSAIGKDQWYWDWVKSGGRYADFVAVDRADLQKKLQDIARDPTAGQTIRRLMNPLNVLNNLQRFSEIMEQATRISEFRRAVESGASKMEAANASKDVTVNFARSGEHGRVLNQLVAFFNANVQDVSKTFRAHAERPLATTMKAIALISVPSALAWWLGKDDKKIQGLPEWRKSFFWNVNVEDLARRAGMDAQGDFILSFPKPFLLGQLYGSSVERALDYAHKRDPNAVSKWMRDLIGTTPATADALIPTSLRPMLETRANYSYFRRQPIENQGMQQLPPELRYTAQSSLFSRKLSELMPWTGLSPLKIDNLMRGYLGGLAKYGTDAVDWVMTRADVMDLPPQPEKGVWERPFFRGFARSPYEASEFVERFYKGIELARQRVEGTRRLVKDGDPAGARDFVKKVGADLGFYTANGGERMTEIARGEKAMSQIAEATRIVQNSRTMTPAEKKQKLTELARARDLTAEGLFKGLISPEDQAKVW